VTTPETMLNANVGVATPRPQQFWSSPRKQCHSCGAFAYPCLAL